MEYINEPVRMDKTNYLSFCGIPCDGSDDKNCSSCDNNSCSQDLKCGSGKSKGWWDWWCIEGKKDL